MISIRRKKFHIPNSKFQIAFKEVTGFDDIAGEGSDTFISKEEIDMFDNVEKVERVARVKGVTNDNRQRFNSGRGRRDETGTFADELRRAMNLPKKVAPVKKTPLPEAYELEITSSGTHSLFYMSGLSLDRLLA